MAYAVLLSEQAKEEIATIKKSGDKPTIKKITKMLVELQEHPSHRHWSGGALEALCL